MPAVLGEYHNGHAIRNQLTLDEHTDEVETGLGSERGAHLDLLGFYGGEWVPETRPALGIHRVDESLTAIAEIDGAPARRVLQPFARPHTPRVTKRDLPVVGGVLAV